MSRKEAHRERMIARRERQNTRTVGFTPMRNARVDGAIDAAVMMAMAQNAELVKQGLVSPLSPVAARQDAVRQVARTLPAPPRVFDWRKGAVSKNNDPAYRKSFVRQR